MAGHVGRCKTCGWPSAAAPAPQAEGTSTCIHCGLPIKQISRFRDTVSRWEARWEHDKTVSNPRYAIACVGLVAAPAETARPKEMTQAEYEVEYAKLCDRYNALLRLNQTPSGEPAGEVTAEQFRLSQSHDIQKATWWSDDRAEAFAKQRVEQVRQKIRDSNLAWERDGNGPDVPVLQPRYDQLKAKVADLERERDDANTQRDALCGYLDTANEIAKRKMDELAAAESELREMREAHRGCSESMPELWRRK